MKDIEVLLLALPAVAAFGFTIYLRNIHEGKSEGHALTRGWTYSILATGFFVLIYLVKFKLASI